MLYYVYKLNDDGTKDRLHITNDEGIANGCRDYQETILDAPVIIETETVPHEVL